MISQDGQTDLRHRRPPADELERSAVGPVADIPGLQDRGSLQRVGDRLGQRGRYDPPHRLVIRVVDDEARRVGDGGKALERRQQPLPGAMLIEMIGLDAADHL